MPKVDFSQEPASEHIRRLVRDERALKRAEESATATFTCEICGRVFAGRVNSPLTNLFCGAACRMENFRRTQGQSGPCGTEESTMRVASDSASLPATPSESIPLIPREPNDTCDICRAPFVREHPRSRYCGKTCAAEARKRKAAVHGRKYRELFPGTRKYKSCVTIEPPPPDRPRSEAAIAQEKARRNTGKPKNCRQCKKSFFPKRQDARFCGTECWKTYRNARLKTKRAAQKEEREQKASTVTKQEQMVSLQCAHCRYYFWHKPSGQQPTFCSNTCRQAAYNAVAKERRKAIKTERVTKFFNERIAEIDRRIAALGDGNDPAVRKKRRSLQNWREQSVADLRERSGVEAAG